MVSVGGRAQVNVTLRRNPGVNECSLAQTQQIHHKIEAMSLSVILCMLGLHCVSKNYATQAPKIILTVVAGFQYFFLISTGLLLSK